MDTDTGPLVGEEGKMRDTSKALRWAGLASTVLAVGLVATTIMQTRALAADADYFAFNAAVNMQNVGIGPSPSGTYTVIDSTCQQIPLPNAVPTDVPGFADLPGDESGHCTSVTGSGALDEVACSTGLMTADWQLSEPSGDNAELRGQGVLVGDVAVLVAAPSAATPNNGYFDPAGSSPGGRAVAVALFTPSANPVCTSTSVDAVVAAAY